MVYTWRKGKTAKNGSLKYRTRLKWIWKTESLLYLLPILTEKKNHFILCARHLLYIFSSNPTGILQSRYYLYFTAEKMVAERLSDSPNVTRPGGADVRPDVAS